MRMRGGLGGRTTVPLQTLLVEGPFRRPYPYLASLPGGVVVIKDIVEDLALHEALSNGRSPEDREFLKEQGMRYHDEAKPLLCELIRGERAGRDITGLRARVQEMVFKMTLLLSRADPGRDATPSWIRRARRDAESPFSYALDVINAMESRQRSSYGAGLSDDRQRGEPIRGVGSPSPVVSRAFCRAPPAEGP